MPQNAVGAALQDERLVLGVVGGAKGEERPHDNQDRGRPEHYLRSEKVLGSDEHGNDQSGNRRAPQRVRPQQAPAPQ